MIGVINTLLSGIFFTGDGQKSLDAVLAYSKVSQEYHGKTNGHSPKRLTYVKAWAPTVNEINRLENIKNDLATVSS